MPAPNKSNPYHCDRPMRKNGKTQAGEQRYRCSCGFSCTDSHRPAHRPTIGDSAMSQKEYTYRYKTKKNKAK